MNYLSGHKSHITEIARLHGEHLFLDAMNNYIDNMMIQDNTCAVISRLCRIDECCTRITEYNGVHIVIKSMKHHPDDPILHMLGIDMLHCLSKNYDMGIKVVDAGAIDCIINVMKNLAHDSCSYYNAFEASATLADNPENSPRIAASGLVDIIRQAMAERPYDERIQRHGSELLRSLELHQSFNKLGPNDHADGDMASCATGAVDVRIANDVPAVFENAHVDVNKPDVYLCQSTQIPMSVDTETSSTDCVKTSVSEPDDRIIDRIARDKDGCVLEHEDDTEMPVTSDDQQPETIVESAVEQEIEELEQTDQPVLDLTSVQSVISTMKQNSDKPDILRRCCIAVISLFKQNYDNQCKMAGLGGIDCIMQAMRMCLDNVGLQVDACSALNYLVVNDIDHDVAMLRCPVNIDLIVTVMKNHVDSLHIQCNCCLLLHNYMCCQPGDSVTSTVDLEAVHCIMNALTLHHDNHNLVHYACCALHGISVKRDAKARAAVAAHGGVGHAISAMTRFGESAPVQRYACRVIAHVASVDTSIVMSDAPNAVALIAAALSRFPDDIKVQYSTLYAVSNLVIQDEFLVKIIDNGCVAHALNAMKRHVDSESIQYYACRILSHAFMSEHAERVKVNDVECITTAMAKYPNNYSLQNYCRLVLHRMKHVDMMTKKLLENTVNAH